MFQSISKAAVARCPLKYASGCCRSSLVVVVVVAAEADDDDDEDDDDYADNAGQ